MSSHHFVKEGQWPVIFYYMVSHFTVEYTKDLLDWTSSVWVDEKSFLTLHNAGVNIDKLFYKQDSFLDENNDLIQVNAPLELQMLRHEKSVVDILDELKSVGCHLISDQSPFDLLETPEKIIVYLSSVQVKWFTSREVFAFYTSQFSKWYEQGEKIEVFCSNSGCKLSGNLQYHQSPQKLVVEVLESGFIGIQSESSFCVKESFE